MIYKKIIRPILFLIPPETIHNVITFFGEFFAKIKIIYIPIRKRLFIDDKKLEVNFKDLKFPNPVGLSAGFDKNGEAMKFIEMVGFGFMEIGSITGLPYKGNPKPRLRRLKKNQGLVVNYGLKGLGAKKVYEKIKDKKSKIPVGISIAKSNLPKIIGSKAIEDYIQVLETFKDYGDYYTINISCPNTYDGMPFTDPNKLEKLLFRINEVKEENHITKPFFLKINPDLKIIQIDKILELVKKYKIDGIVVGNLFKNRKKAKSALSNPDEYNIEWKGGVSGKALKDISTDRIRYIRQRAGKDLFIIGCGGIFTGDDAYEKLQAGANVLQLITGFVYNGPTTIRDINKRLLELKK